MSVFFYSVRKEVIGTYRGIFDTDAMDEDEVRMEEQETNQQSFAQRFGWYLILNRVAGDDITKHDGIFKKSLVEVLNQVAYLVDKDREIEKERRKAMNQIS
jgi:hypothetical protein